MHHLQGNFRSNLSSRNSYERVLQCQSYVSHAKHIFSNIWKDKGRERGKEKKN